MEEHDHPTGHACELEKGERFAFGSNWAKFLAVVDEERIALAARSLAGMLEVEDLSGKTFLDVGCGSGLFSLAARRLCAAVRSFDFDGESVTCALELKRRFAPEDPDWIIEEGSILDDEYVSRLGSWDVVYSWGVLHHTGRLWDSLDAACKLVVPGGRLFVAIYNDQGRRSRRWLTVKKTYNALPRPLRWVLLVGTLLRLWGPTILRDALSGRPLSTWSRYGANGRGMSPWRDVVDWAGGLPFEVAKPEEVFDFCRERGFRLARLKTAGGGHGCNEYVFVKCRHAAADAETP